METNFKNVAKKNPSQHPIEKRMEALKILLELDKPTSKAMLYSEYENKPNVVYI